MALVAPAARDFCSGDCESLRPSAGQLRVATLRRAATSATRSRTSAPGTGRPARVRRAVAAEGMASAS